MSEPAFQELKTLTVDDTESNPSEIYWLSEAAANIMKTCFSSIDESAGVVLPHPKAVQDAAEETVCMILRYMRELVTFEDDNEQKE